MPNLGNPHIRRATIMASYSRLVKMVIISLAFIALSSYVSTIACGTLGDQSLGATRSRSKVGLLPYSHKPEPRRLTLTHQLHSQFQFCNCILHAQGFIMLSTPPQHYPVLFHVTWEEAIAEIDLNHSTNLYIFSTLKYYLPTLNSPL